MLKKVWRKYKKYIYKRLPENNFKASYRLCGVSCIFHTSCPELFYLLDHKKMTHGKKNPHDPLKHCKQHVQVTVYRWLMWIQTSVLVSCLWLVSDADFLELVLSLWWFFSCSSSSSLCFLSLCSIRSPSLRWRLISSADPFESRCPLDSRFSSCWDSKVPSGFQPWWRTN